MPNLPLVSSITTLLGSYLIWKLVFRKRRLPLPPGPKGLLIIGNVADLPPKEGLEWQHWFKHKDLYGPLSSVTVFGQTIILLHDLKAAVELLDNRGARYSSRGRMVFAGEMLVLVISESRSNGVLTTWCRCGYNERMPFRPNNQIFRQQRKLAAGQPGTRTAITKFHSGMNLEVGRMLLRTLDKPGHVISHLET